MVSLPAPPVIVLATSEPLIDNAVAIAVAFTFVKFVIAVEPETSWFGVLARFSVTAAAR